MGRRSSENDTLLEEESGKTGFSLIAIVFLTTVVVDRRKKKWDKIRLIICFTILIIGMFAIASGGVGEHLFRD
jgi:hypothetical protein